jgi:putative SOS response-associated peptidase YedK
MCGRYASSRRPEDLIEEFEVVDNRVPTALQADYNVAPTKEVYAVVERPPSKEAGEQGVPPERQLRTLTWGLVPSWAKDPKIGNRMINARMETVAEKPAFKKAFATRRCILPADGYYEWYTAEEKVNGKPVKQPYFIHPADGSVLAMAGLYEIWRDKSVADPDKDEAWLWTCTVLTTTATDDLGRIHDRMPLLVERERYDAWLDPLSSDPDDLLDLLVPAAPGRLEAYAVSKAVSSVKNNGPHLLDPLPPDGVDPLDKPAAPEETTLF